MTLPSLPAQGSTNWYSHYSAVDTAVRNLQTGTPTLEELERWSLLGTISATATFRLGPVNFDQRIGALTLAASAAVAASDTDYWSVSLLRLRAGQSPLTIATRTTQATGGQAFTADQGWAFDDVGWLETARHLRKGDVFALTFTKTGAPANLADVSVAVRYEPNVLPAIRDTFSRTDSATSLGTADTGQAWTALSGTWGISSGQAYAPTLVGGQAFATLNVGVTDFTVAVRLTAGTASGLLVNVVDASNFWVLDNTDLWKQVAGVYTSVGAATGGAVGDTWAISRTGPTIRAFKNGVLMVTANDSTFQSTTTVGLYAPSTANRYDDLAVTL